MFWTFKHPFMALILSYFLSTTALYAQGQSDEEILKSLGFDFVLDSKALVSKKNAQGYYELGLGIAVDQSCFKLYPQKEIAVIFQKMLVRGLSCMKREERGENVKRDLESFQKLLSNRSNLSKLECDKPLPDTAYAIGSSPGSSRRHPYIYLSNMGNKEFKEKPAFFQGVVFHELLHNIRYFHHPDDMEVTSACEECCFGEMTGDKKLSACKICGGAYETISDPEYIKSLLVWDGRFYGRLIVEEQFDKALKDPVIVKEVQFKEAMESFLKDLNSPVESKKALEQVDRLLAFEFEAVEKELLALPETEISNRYRFLYYRLMAMAARSQGNLALEKAYKTKAEACRDKYKNS